MNQQVIKMVTKDCIDLWNRLSEVEQRSEDMIYIMSKNDINRVFESASELAEALNQGFVQPWHLEKNEIYYKKNAEGYVVTFATLTDYESPYDSVYLQANLFKLETDKI